MRIEGGDKAPSVQAPTSREIPNTKVMGWRCSACRGRALLTVLIATPPDFRSTRLSCARNRLHQVWFRPLESAVAAVALPTQSKTLARSPSNWRFAAMLMVARTRCLLRRQNLSQRDKFHLSRAVRGPLEIGNSRGKAASAFAKAMAGRGGLPQSKTLARVRRHHGHSLPSPDAVLGDGDIAARCPYYICPGKNYPSTSGDNMRGSFRC